MDDERPLRTSDQFVSEEPAVEPFANWKDPQGYVPVLACCAACWQGGKGPKIALPSKAKALNHWAANGSGRDPAATIKDCVNSCLVPRLREFARQELKARALARTKKKQLEQRQREVDA